jgi:hypothetical protein
VRPGARPAADSRHRRTMSALLLVVAAVGGAAPLGHMDLLIRPCDATDQQQLWDFGTRGLGRGGPITHQSSKQCLVAGGCHPKADAELALDACDLCSTPPQWTLHHQGQHPLALTPSNSPTICAAAFPSHPFVVLKACGSPGVPLPYQKWTSIDPHSPDVPQTLYKGPNHQLKVGTDKDGKPMCEKDPCCLSAHADLIPDGDGGWVLTVAIALAATVYVLGGLYIGRRRGLKTHIHIAQAGELLGLVKDGVAFTAHCLSGNRRGDVGGISVQHGSAIDKTTPLLTAASTAQASLPRQGAACTRPRDSRGRQGKRRVAGLPGWQASSSTTSTAAHHAAAAGDAAALTKLIDEAVAGGGPGCLDGGDAKRWTAFHVACGSGHAACATLLLRGKACDPALRNEDGMTGLELARQMGHASVVAALNG